MKILLLISFIVCAILIIAAVREINLVAQKKNIYTLSKLIRAKDPDVKRQLKKSIILIVLGIIQIVVLFISMIIITDR